MFLKQLAAGLLLVTGPYALNGVPLRRVPQSYVIGTSTTVDVSGVKVPDSVNDDFFKKPKSQKKKNDELFFEKVTHKHTTLWPSGGPIGAFDVFFYSFFCPQIAKAFLTPLFSSSQEKEKTIDGERKKLQDDVDGKLVQVIGKDALLKAYISSKFSLKNGDKPHNMVF